MISFSQTAGTSGITTIVVTATSRQEISALVAEYTLANTSGHSVLFPITQKAYAPMEKYIQFNPSAFTWSASGGSGSLQITSNDNWRIVSDGWILFNRNTQQVAYNELSGNGNTLVGINSTENTGSTRNGGITGYCLSNSSITATTSIAQTGGYSEKYLELNYYTYGAAYSGITGASLTVSSNTEWYSYSDEPWITVNTVSGTGNGSVSFDIEATDQALERRGSIIVIDKDNGIVRTCNVSQPSEPVAEPYLIIVPTGSTMPLSGGTFIVTVSSNTSWETSIQSQDDSRAWVTLSDLNGYGDTVVTGTVYSALTGRSATILFFNEKEDLKVEFNLEQTTMENRKLYYTSTGGTVVTPYVSTGWGANIVSNTYENGQGVILFDDNVTTIPARAFHNKHELQTLVIPESVTTINGLALYNCDKLETLYYNAINVTGTTSDTHFVYYCTGLTSIIIGDSVVNIPPYLFYRCAYLTGLTLGNNIRNIGDYAFWGYKQTATALTIPDKVETIGKLAFYGGSSVRRINLGKALTSFEGDSFKNTVLRYVYSYNTTCPTINGTLTWPEYPPANGILHYPSGSDYSSFIAKLPTGWGSTGDIAVTVEEE